MTIFYKYCRHDCGIFLIKYAQFLLHNDITKMLKSFDAGKAMMKLAALHFKNKQQRLVEEPKQHQMNNEIID